MFYSNVVQFSAPETEEKKKNAIDVTIIVRLNKSTLKIARPFSNVHRQFNCKIL